MKYILYFISAGFFINVICSQEMPIKSTDMKAIKKILEKEVGKDKSPSVQYLFFNADRVIYEHTTGYAELESGMEIDGKQTFNALSITKTFTAMAVLQLAEQGKVILDHTVNAYLPDANVPEEVTVYHLLTHTSGLPNPLPLRWIHLTSEHKNFNRDDFFDPVLAENSKLKSPPGSRFRYSNLGYIYLGRIIENVSGLVYEEYIKRNIIDRLALQSDVLNFKVPDSTVHVTGYHKRRSFSGLLLNVMIDKSKFMGPPVQKWRPFKHYYVNGSSYGGLIGNANGFVKYGQDLIRENSILLSAKSKKLLFTENTTTKGEKTGMCLAWFKGELDGHEYYVHAGGGGGYYCELRLYPDSGLGSFVFFNRSGFRDERFLDRLDQYLLPTKQLQQWIKTKL